MKDFEKKGKTKVRTCITINEKSLEDARKKNLNISAICQEAVDLAIKGKFMKKTGS